jgi:hypothetical protein
MEISYRTENGIDWSIAEKITIRPTGWKEVTITFIDCHPLVFWRINDIPNNFQSRSDEVSKRGVERFFSENLEFLKAMIVKTIDEMPEERSKFYKENIIKLFDE